MRLGASFAPAAFKAGTKLHRQSRIQSIEPLATGVIRAVVRGKNGHPFAVTCGVGGDPESLVCDCPGGERCEHVAATVLALRAVTAGWRRARERASEPARHAVAGAPSKKPGAPAAPSKMPAPPTAPDKKQAPPEAPRKKQAAPAPPESAPELPPTTHRALERWAATRGVAELLGPMDDEFFVILRRGAPAQLDLAYRLDEDGATLADIIVGDTGYVRGSATLRDVARGYLAEIAEARASYLRSVRTRRFAPASDPSLASHVVNLLAIRAGLLQRGVYPRAPGAMPSVNVEFNSYPVEIRVVEASPRWTSSAPRVAAVRLHPDGGAQLMSPVIDALSFEAVDHALAVLTEPKNAAYAKDLRRELAVPPWQRLVDRLAVVGRPPEGPSASADFELGWRLSLRGAPGDAALVPLECRKKGGGGYKVKQLDNSGWDQLGRREEHPGDAAVCSVLGMDADYSAASAPTHEVVLGVALPALVGHPRFFLRDGSDAHLALRRGHLALATRDHDDSFEVGFELDGSFLTAAEVAVARGRVVIDRWLLFAPRRASTASLCPLSAALADAIAAAADIPPLLPAEASKPFLGAVMQARTRLPLALSEGLRGPSASADPRVRLRLALAPDGLTVAAIVKPAPELASEIPGEGQNPLYVERAGALVAVTRDLAGERAAADRLWHDLALAPADAFTDLLPLGDALFDLVRTLGARDGLEVEWGSAERVAVASPVAFDSLELEARRGKGRTWFAMHGRATVEGGGGVPLAELLRAIREGQRYVRVDDGRWAEIDQAVSRRLGAIAKRHGQVPALMAPLVADLEDAGAELRGVAELHAALAKLRAARGLVVATPSGLEAELRPYQEEGFAWLARLAAWAPGACLADDMGLGKTVQALGLMLHRTSEGATLVVAPTSLGFNWVREAQKFAPSLRLHAVRTGAELAALGPVAAGDVVVTSYGLVARHVERLAEVAWATLVVDEAQTVKNASTKRAQALRGLSAGFTLALTGTPIENRASELWSLFRLIAPGLLGGEQAFREEFAAPIERGDEVARAGLAALITPFVLRRLKRNVARDLPQRTEVQLEVVLGKAERERYEKIRQATLRLLDGEDGTPHNERRFKALQALTRLRQLACHPGLVDPGWSGGSAKLEAVSELLSRLGEEGHRALVFSQFTSFLGRVRERLEADGVATLYLDGQTSPSERQARVDAFQAGTADAFLLSLKAGGTGLNLTAATYVIHLDPWWNPAVEDQATDRTHRIGQNQPVTVYRLVAKDTVEEGIVKLHADKRELADALLAGTGSSAALTYEEMVRLIGGGVGPALAVIADEDEDDDDDDGDGGTTLAPVIDLGAARERLRAAVEHGPAPAAAAPAVADAPAEPGDLAARFEAALTASAVGGEIRASTAGSYRRAGGRFIAFAQGRGFEATSEAALEAYLAALADGSAVAAKSEAAMARAAFKWIARMRDPG